MLLLVVYQFEKWLFVIPQTPSTLFILNHYYEGFVRNLFFKFIHYLVIYILKLASSYAWYGACSATVKSIIMKNLFIASLITGLAIVGLVFYLSDTAGENKLLPE